MIQEMGSASCLQYLVVISLMFRLQVGAVSSKTAPGPLPQAKEEALGTFHSSEVHELPVHLRYPHTHSVQGPATSRHCVQAEHRSSPPRKLTPFLLPLWATFFGLGHPSLQPERSYSGISQLLPCTSPCLFFHRGKGSPALWSTESWLSSKEVENTTHSFRRLL